MKILLLSTCIIILLSGCIIDIDGGKWGEGWDDTGTSLDDEDALDDPIYRVTPDVLQPGANDVLTITADAPVDWESLQGVTAIGDLEVVDFKTDGLELWVGVIVPIEALDGPAHLIFEFEDGTVHFAREALMIGAVEEGEELDTGLLEDEPNQE